TPSSVVSASCSGASTIVNASAGKSAASARPPPPPLVSRPQPCHSGTTSDRSPGAMTYFRYVFNQPNTSSCQRLLFCGLRTQLPSSGNNRALLGQQLR